ncbi:VOC family protein [Salmonirosea aquatica]|uniref:VOC family protein n=1 Tax=Salmonirosea aquatica TaxID=2654236 RepID=A0A7C9FCP4_9BACT|nr:VOC family protein [Cytophagaceae bacterium SJW1-29]
MAKINTYLTFSGNCREAMTFYQKCLGGELSLMTIGESPMAERMPKKMKDSILHATLRKDGLTLLASDMVDEETLNRGNSISLMLDCESEAEVRGCFDKLAADGNPTHPLENTFWGALFGGLTDKYGNQWLLHFDRNAY